MKRAPWKGTPPPPVSDRPICANCGKPLRPHVEEERPAGSWAGDPTHRVWTAGPNRHVPGYDGCGYFCTKRCAARFANRSVAALRGEATR